MNKLIRASQKGFTLIELLVVIGILGIMAAVLIVLIDPVDKINSANDAGVISAVSQFGRANDRYAATHSNTYVGGATVNAALGDLLAAGESKYSTYTVPNANYTVGYAALTSGGAACTTAGANCGQYAFYVTGLRSKRYTTGTLTSGSYGNGSTAATTGTIYVYANGKGCYAGTGTSVAATANCP